MPELRVAVVGVGYMGRNHARVVSELSSELPVELAALVDVDESRVRAVAERYGATPYTSLEKLLSNEDLDVAIVATPTATHVSTALRLVEAGVRYMLIEKPLAENTSTARRLLEALGSSGVERVMVGHIERFNPAVRHLVRSLERGLLGEIITASSRRVGPYVPRIRDVGVVMDLATHEIDLARLFFDSEPVGVYAYTYRVVNEVYEDAAIVVLHFDKGSAVIEVNRVTPYKERRLLLTCTRGVAQLDYIAQSLRVFNSEWEMDARIQHEEPLKIEDREFLRAALEGAPVPVNALDGYKAVKIAEAALVSASKGTVVRLDLGSEE